MRDRHDKGWRETCMPVIKPGNKEKGERGFILVIVLIIIAALALLGLAASRNMLTDIGIAENHGGNTKSFYAAEAAAEYAYNQFNTLLMQGTVPTAAVSYTAAVPNVGCTINSATASAVSYSPTPSIEQTLSSSNSNPLLSKYAGLTAWMTQYTISATATDPNTSASSTVTLPATEYLIPIFQFGIFYNGILEMNPGANLTIPVNGWIHTNSTLYTSTSATETINSHITSAGQIDHGRAPNDTTAWGTGTVNIEGSNGTYYALNNGSQSYSNGTWSANSSWATTEQQWGTNVANGVVPLVLPVPSAQTGQQPQPEYTNSEYLLSQPNNGVPWPQTLAAQAALIITDGVATDASGTTWSTNGSVTTNGTMYDYRQQSTVDLISINVANFQASPAGIALATASKGGTPGVLYVTSANHSNYMAVSLTNGATVASTGNWINNGTPVGFTVATDLPAYVQGNYNTANVQNTSAPPPAAIMSDALTILSNQWSSSYNSGTAMTGTNGRLVTEPYTINADVMTGNSATTAQNGYGGGFENFIRFLEDWGDNGKGNQNFNFGGSLVCEWTAAKATGKWIAPGTYYNPPSRNYTFGVFGNNWPPGTPKAVVVARGNWRNQ